MIFVVLFIATILLLVGVVHVGAVALKLTGMRWDNAWFQALSAFTGTGFTTNKAEQITKNDKRRSIITWLMILGNAGLATVVITILKTLEVHMNINFLWQAVYLVAIILLLYILYLILSRRADTKQIIDNLNKLIEKYLLNAGEKKTKMWEEILHLKQGFGFARVIIEPACIFCGTPLVTSGLVQHQIIVVAIERESQFIPTPGGDEVLEPGDMVVCYGKLKNIRKEFVDMVKEPVAPGDGDSQKPPDDGGHDSARSSPPE